MDDVRIVFNDLASAKAFFVELGLELQGRGRSRALWWTAWWGSRASGRSSR
jgi:hypothetical protein